MVGWTVRKKKDNKRGERNWLNQIQGGTFRKSAKMKEITTLNSKLSR